MAQQYSPLLGLNILHSYYSNGLSRDFRLTPSPVTASILRKLDIRPKENDSGMELYWGYEMREGLPKGPLKEFTEDLVLTFLLEPKSATFFNFTDLPFPESAGHKYYYQGRYAAPVDETPISLDGQEVVMHPMQSVLPFTPPAVATDLDLELVTVAGEPLGVDTIPAKLSQKEKYPVAIDASEDWGAYTLKVRESATSNSIGSEAVHVLPGSILVRCFGLLQLVIPASEIAILSPPSGPGQTVAYPKFTIAFEKRSTHWRYNFINSSNLDYDRLQIMDGDQEINIIAKREKELLDGNQATEVTLPDALPLEEATNKKISLRLLQNTPGGGDPKILYDIRLPTPNTDRIYPERSGDDLVIYSDLFVYL